MKPKMENCIQTCLHGLGLGTRDNCLLYPRLLQTSISFVAIVETDGITLTQYNLF